MERGNITKWLLLGLAIFLALTYGRQAIFPTKPVQHVWSVQDQTAPPERAPEERCTLEGNQFKAELSTRGGSLRSYVLTDPRFDSIETHLPTNLVSTTAEGRSPLRTDLRVLGKPDDAQALKYDDLDWHLAASDGKSCTFTYEDASTSLKKTIAATGRPYELTIDLQVKNLADQPKAHRLTVEQTAYRHRADMEGGMMKRQPELATEVVASSDKKTDRWSHDDFKPDELEKEKAEAPAKRKITPEEWRQVPGAGHFAAVSTSYFTNMLEPESASEGATPIGPPVAEGQVESIWDTARYGTTSEGLAKDPNPSYAYRARLAYPEETLAPGATATYRLIAFAGPKDHDLIAALKYPANEVLKLSWGAPLALVKGLVWYLGRIHGVLGSWGWSIVVLTISVRLLLFPLSLSQIKNSAAMRRLKPEMDVINAKYKDDAAQKGLAIQELWRKNGVANPVVGCVPMLLQMPVWFALYSALQTLVELYHVPFGPASGVIPDLVAPGKYFVIPIVLGASSFLQQRIMPAQGDPAQQKMMMYMMPAIFTFMMLFLPAGLGVYMLTNSLLAIGQQLLVERYLKGNRGPTGQIEVKEKPSGDGSKPTPALGKGKARARG